MQDTTGTAAQHTTRIKRTLIFDDVQYVATCEGCGDYGLFMDEASAEASRIAHADPTRVSIIDRGEATR